MLKIAITQPFTVDEECAFIRHLLANGFDIVHLRKPDADIDYCRDLLQQLSPSLRSRIVIHDHYSLYEEFALRGVHLNRNVEKYPLNYRGQRSRSCHSIEEVVRFKHDYDYLFLSPIFDSISKPDYRSKFSHFELLSASQRGVIDSRVVALGGVTLDKLSYLQSLGFGGFAMMGGIQELYAKDATHQ